MNGQRIPHRLRKGEKLDSGVHPFGVFPEYHQVDIVPVVERIAGVALAGPEVDIEVEFLAEPDDGAEIGEALATEFRLQFELGVFLRFRSDGPEQAGVGFLEQLDGPRGKGVPLGAPEFPADIALEIVRVKPQPAEDDQGRLDDIFPHSVAGENGDAVF